MPERKKTDEIHKNHRQRLKEQFRKNGLDGMTDIQVLELLLFYCIPRVDTNPIAHDLLRRFGSVTDVLDAPPQELEKVDGIGPGAADFLKLIRELDRYREMERRAKPRYLDTVEACGDFLVPCFKNLQNETVYLLCLDAACKLLSCRMVGEGSVNSAAVPVRRIVEMALASKASSVVLAHNHPSGIAVPSAEDILTTRRVAAALDAVEIVLTDHIIVADGDYVSLVDSDLYRPEDYRVMY